MTEALMIVLIIGMITIALAPVIHQGVTWLRARTKEKSND